MKRFCLLVGLLGALGTAAMANPACIGDGTLQSYITGSATFSTACQIGDKLFWGFGLSYNVPPGTAGAGPTASQILVQTIPGDGLTNIGISFNSGGFSIANSFVIDGNITFNVATASGAPIMEDATLSIVGTLSGTTGSATVTETLTPGVFGSPLTASLPNNTSQHTDFSLTPVTTLAVNDHIVLVGGRTFSDIAHVSVIENDFSEFTVPEPLVSVLFGSGLVLLGAMRKRLKGQPAGGKN
jgi:hypothetical protein